jgi:hypothetical protein
MCDRAIDTRADEGRVPAIRSAERKAGAPAHPSSSREERVSSPALRAAATKVLGALFFAASEVSIHEARARRRAFDVFTHEPDAGPGRRHAMSMLSVIPSEARDLGVANG